MLRKLIFTEYPIIVIAEIMRRYEQLQKLACTFYFQKNFGSLGAFLNSSWTLFCYCKIGLSAVEKANILETIF